jgi:16S rRNA (adenine1518-N6/adenine1519-N6)-dimethyltransferase
MNLCDVKTIKDVMSIFGLTFRKEFGQNFLTDKSVVEAIADSCAAANTKTVLEIGAGCGSLTHELALRYEKVIAIEIDRGLIPLLGYTLGEHKNVEVICGDVMKTDIRALLGDAFERGGVSVCANLPYYITTPILLELLGSGLPFDCITVMIQSEVADRLCASAGHRDYGSVTAYLNYFGTCQKLLKVPAGKFLPPPKVDSTVVRIDLYKDKPYKPLDEALFFRTLRAAFEQRRKTLPNALSAGISELSKDELTDAILACGFAANIRGEVLSTADFVKLSDEIYKRIK